MTTDTAQEQGQTTAAPKARVTILDKPIHVWSPMKEGQPFLAMIEGFAFTFKGTTALRAKKAAETFRQEEGDWVVNGKRKPKPKPEVAA